jgi:hypothetical protein
MPQTFGRRLKTVRGHGVISTGVFAAQKSAQTGKIGSTSEPPEAAKSPEAAEATKAAEPSKSTILSHELYPLF